MQREFLRSTKIVCAQLFRYHYWVRSGKSMFPSKRITVKKALLRLKTSNKRAKKIVCAQKRNTKMWQKKEHKNKKIIIFWMSSLCGLRKLKAPITANESRQQNKKRLKPSGKIWRQQEQKRILNTCCWSSISAQRSQSTNQSKTKKNVKQTAHKGA